MLVIRICEIPIPSFYLFTSLLSALPDSGSSVKTPSSEAAQHLLQKASFPFLLYLIILVAYKTDLEFHQFWVFGQLESRKVRFGPSTFVLDFGRFLDV
ncbi:hypothetical protein HHI36_001284 [Cryptolaemus montrouzieri]|uniref:Uncharacterized protein n=1 Tax=Cryptolaemus montrouzieri TaxID=559131 RepID=A0ABD2P8I8_9CUCU